MDTNRRIRSPRERTSRAYSDLKWRVWTDRRDGTKWSIRAYWSLDELATAWLLFESDSESHGTWWVSRRNLVRLTDTQLQRLLDEARTGG